MKKMLVLIALLLLLSACGQPIQKSAEVADSPAPAMIAASTLGIRMFQMMRTCAALPFFASAAKQSARVMRDEPTKRQTKASTKTASVRRTIAVVFFFLFFNRSACSFIENIIIPPMALHKPPGGIFLSRFCRSLTVSGVYRRTFAKKRSTPTYGFFAEGRTPLPGFPCVGDDLRPSYPRAAAHIHGARENWEWFVCMQASKNGPAIWPRIS